MYLKWNPPFFFFSKKGNFAEGLFTGIHILDLKFLS